MVEQRLRQAALWDEVKDRLKAPALCASPAASSSACASPARWRSSPRCCSWTSPPAPSTPSPPRKIEELIHELQGALHHRHRHPQHAAGGARLRRTAFFYMGELVEMRAHRAASSPTRARPAPRTTSPGSSDEPAGGDREGTWPRPTPTRRTTPSSARCARSCWRWAAWSRRPSTPACAPSCERDAALAEQVIRRTGPSTGWRWTSTAPAGASWPCASRPPATCASSPPPSRSSPSPRAHGRPRRQHRRRAIDLAQAPPLQPLHDLARLAALSEAALAEALDAFVTADPVKAEEVLQDDDHLDALYLKIFNDLLSTMMEDPRSIRRATSLMFSAKHLERFGDHATNLAEMVIFMVARHRRPARQEQAPSGPPGWARGRHPAAPRSRPARPPGWSVNGPMAPGRPSGPTGARRPGCGGARPRHASR